ncbi:MAG: MerR family transcriptional regulator [Deltaproteobacteria bacterium]|nr:MerR family transcriptional regulator [Deltaproteobacteria bacterium]
MARRTTQTRGTRTRTSRQVTLVSRRALCFLSGISERQLTVWEREEFIVPATVGDVGGDGEPLYDREALRRARVIRTLEEELDVNLPGIGVILNLLERINR